jgi:alkanesulfonate monooxygenase SsuD/methylene tetrahydromethanopterin reductase-like flavin-dependent oxidoreductase (luciferase family)
MELLTAVVLLPLQNPVDLAEQAATMNAMVDGRFILGLGLGHQADEQVAFGVSRDSVAARFEEALAVMERLWDGEGQAFHGEYYNLPKLDLAWPIPYARPRIWIGGSGQRALRRARTHNLPWFPSELDLEGVVEGYRTHPPADPNASRPVGLWVHIAETDDEALADAARFGQVDPARPNYPVSIIGSPDTVLRRIREYQERLGATHILARVQPPGMGQVDSMRRIQLLAERVIPELS